MNLPQFLLTVFIVFFSLNAYTQNTRIQDRNQIGWWAGFATFNLHEKWSIHSEYQWRRENFVSDWQQGLLRVGLNYQHSARVQLRAGYAWIETFNYGNYPINVYGKDFTEHRTYQMLSITDKLGRLNLTHRFMLEQRWVGRYSSPNLTREDEYAFLNRIRYMLRIQWPLKIPMLDKQAFYTAAYDEILIGFGKNVNENIFDQNRFGWLLGYQFNKKFRIEGGIFNQILQLPREIMLQGQPNSRNVFQHNTGFIINTFLTIDCKKAR